MVEAAWMMIRPCAEPGCPNPATYRGRCKAHARANDKQINRAGRTIYSTKRWRITRRHVLFDHPICQAQGCEALASEVHHVVPIAEGGDLYSLTNLQALCGMHHSMITRREMAR